MFDDAVLLFVIGMLLVGAIQLYGRRTSGIAHRPYHHIHGGAPGAARTSVSADRDIRNWSRGTR